MGSLARRTRGSLLKSRVAAGVLIMRASTHRRRAGLSRRTITTTAATLKAPSIACWRTASSTPSRYAAKWPSARYATLIRPQQPVKRIKIEAFSGWWPARQRQLSTCCSGLTANAVRPRQVAMYWAKTLTLALLPAVAAALAAVTQHGAPRRARSRGAGREGCRAVGRGRVVRSVSRRSERLPVPAITWLPV